MILFYKWNNTMLHIYTGPIDKQDIDSWENIMTDIFIGMRSGEKLDVYVDLTNAKVLDRSLNLEQARFTKENKFRFNKIIIANMAPFVKILYKAYLLFTGMQDIHQVDNLDLNAFCQKYNLQIPNLNDPQNSNGFYKSTK